MDGYQNIYKKYNEYFGKTARFHILLLISKLMLKEKMYVKTIGNIVKAGLCFAGAFVCEHAELKKRLAIHNNRK